MTSCSTRVVALVLSVAAMAAAPAPAQTADPCGPIRANFDYTPNPFGGAYAIIRNRRGSDFNFSVGHVRVPLADPTILRLAVNGIWTYYVTGTSDHCNTANFAIYRSTDLVRWTYHGTAFPECNRNGGNQITINGRVYCEMWAPQLYESPFSPGTIVLSFTASESRWANNYCGTQLKNQSVQMATIPKASFTAGGAYFAALTNQPNWYSYSLNNDFVNYRNDGGVAQYPSGLVPIAVTGSRDLPAARQYGEAFGFDGLETDEGYRTNAWMALDSFVFVDQVAPFRKWLLYTWRAKESPDRGYNGNHVAAFPLITDTNTDATYSNGALQMAYRANYLNRAIPLTGPYNGCYGANGGTFDGCVAEGPAAFFSTETFQTYFLFSRNAWDSPAYGIFYRRSSGGLESLNAPLPNWDHSGLNEKPIVMSANRTLPYGPGFGHGEMFLGPGNKAYLIYHAKDQGKVAQDGSVSYWIGLSGRSVYFKEVRFNGQDIFPITNSGTGKADDTDTFLIPWTVWTNNGEQAIGP